MAPQQPTPDDLVKADFARALEELARGEQTASVMENQLTALEHKIDALLATTESQDAANTDDRNETQERRLNKNQVDGK
ncbi:MAG: hypothetical protein LQ341_002588 [Variospora aurantia]|nr:MAG: hypothetical protein LQ341_002588 [Variospora aurantia]